MAEERTFFLQYIGEDMEAVCCDSVSWGVIFCSRLSAVEKSVVLSSVADVKAVGENSRVAAVLR